MVALGGLGLYHKFFFSFMLLFVFALSPDLQNVSEAITVPAKQLGLTFYVIAASTFIYSCFGFQYKKLGKGFMYDEQAELMVEHFKTQNMIWTVWLNMCVSLGP